MPARTASGHEKTLHGDNSFWLLAVSFWLPSPGAGADNGSWLLAVSLWLASPGAEALIQKLKADS
jgi:hypothetical protein